MLEAAGSFSHGQKHGLEGNWETKSAGLACDTCGNQGHVSQICPSGGGARTYMLQLRSGRPQVQELPNGVLKPMPKPSKLYFRKTSCTIGVVVQGTATSMHPPLVNVACAEPYYGIYTDILSYIAGCDGSGWKKQARYCIK